jgi:hypothetical protein
MLGQAKKGEKRLADMKAAGASAGDVKKEAWLQEWSGLQQKVQRLTREAESILLKLTLQWRVIYFS